MNQLDLNQNPAPSRLNEQAPPAAPAPTPNYYNRQSRTESQKMKKPLPILYAIPAVLLVGSFFAGTQIFSSPIPTPAPTTTATADESGLLSIDDSMPRDQVCPLNGALYTQAEKDAWETRRPLAVMIENTPDARPQSGLSSADITFEVVAEGGITRFMPIFYCDVQREDVVLAPIRSARTYYINLASGFNYPMYVHVGGANDDSTPETHALNQLADYGWVAENDINQFSVGYPTFVRDYDRIPGKEVATEHTMTTTTEGLWEVASDRGWTNMSPELTIGRETVEASDWADGYQGWDFAVGSSQGTVNSISYSFWSGMSDYDVSWAYDSATNLYTRSNGGTVQVDMNNNQPITVSNVITMFVEETGPLNDVKHMMYDVIGSGEATLFNNGQATDINWSKDSREAELEFTDSKGEPITMTSGKIWISVLAEDTDINY